MSPQKIAVMVLLISFMLNIGLQVHRDTLLAALRNQSLLGRAFLANFVIVPIFAALLVSALAVSPLVATGILLMAISAGIPFLPGSAGPKKGGNLEFALCLAFLLPAISTITVPITARFILPVPEQPNVPIGPVIVNLVLFQLVPLLIGMAVAQRAPATAAKIARPLLLLAVLCVLFVLGSAAPAIVKAFGAVLGTRGLLTALILVLLSLATGWALGGPQPSHRRTLSIATAMRNITIALLVATLNFAGTAVVPTVMCYFVIQLVCAIVAGQFFARSFRAPAAAPG